MVDQGPVFRHAALSEKADHEVENDRDENQRNEGHSKLTLARGGHDSHSSAARRLWHLSGTSQRQRTPDLALRLERTMGLEPTTPGLGSQCSTN